MRGTTESLPAHPSHIILAKGDSGKLFKVAAEHREDGSGYLTLTFIIGHEPDVSPEKARSRLFPALEDILGLRFEALKAWRTDEARLPGRLLAEAEARIEAPQAPRSLFKRFFDGD